TFVDITFNAFGTLQRDAPPLQISPNYPDPPPATDDPTTAFPFDALVAALPFSNGGEESQLQRIAELQVENDVICQDLQKRLEAASKNFLANFAHLMEQNLSIMRFTN
ncbi:unnamed protein product, partial [Eruca vesicaria subsp. sativa]|nr:unnamed protein product [Eruca vesicaria subsp. sativa]